MANTMRWRYGETNPVMMDVAAESVIEIGDLVFEDEGTVKPAAALVDEGALLDNQGSFHQQFAGVAMQCSPAGSAAPIRVATTGVFEYACPASTYQVGDFVGACENAGGTELESQAVTVVASADLAIGRCVKRVDPAGVRVLVDLVSVLVKGGPQAAA